MPVKVSAPGASIHRDDFDAGLQIGVAEFVRLSQRESYWDLMCQIYDEILDRETGSVLASLTEERACEVCSERSSQSVFTKDGFDHVRCSECSFVFVNPVLSPEGREQVVRRIAELRAKRPLEPPNFYFSGLQKEFDDKRFVYGLQLLEANGGMGRILDVGTGTGHFLDVAAERGWEATGLEPAMLPNTDRPIERGFLTADTFPSSSFDAVTFWDVIGSVTGVRELLGLARDVLKPGALLLVTTHNINSLAVRLMRDRSATFGGISAINFFGPETLGRILETCGLTLVHLETIISELGTIRNWLGLEDPYRGTARESFLDFITPDYVHSRLMGYRLLAIARRPE